MLTSTILFSLIPIALAVSEDSSFNVPINLPVNINTNLQKRQRSQNLIHVSNVFAQCDNVCSWSFHLSGQDTPDIPGFGADCSGIGVSRGDRTFQNCQITGSGSQYGLNLNYVQAWFSLRPRNGQRDSSQLQVVISVGNPGAGSTQYFGAYQTGQYQQFASGQLNEIDILATYYAGAA